MSSPLARPLDQAVPAVAGGADDVTVIGRAPFAGTVSSVTYAAKANITGAATDHRRFRLVNKGTDGNGTTIVAELLFNSGAVTALDYDEKALTLSATPANLVVADGDILAFESTHIGTGIADPGGLVRVSITRS